MRTGRSHWREHPAVNNDLTLGERAADWLKHWFGTWTALFGVGAIIAFWVLMQLSGIRWDLYPYILLNLCLSCLAAVQGIILQISANRQDRINAQASLHDRGVMELLKVQSCSLLELQQQQMKMLGKLEELDDTMDAAVAHSSDPQEHG